MRGAGGLTVIPVIFRNIITRILYKHFINFISKSAGARTKMSFAASASSKLGVTIKEKKSTCHM